jgi:hypothetical protein
MAYPGSRIFGSVLVVSALALCLARAAPGAAQSLDEPAVELAKRKVELGPEVTFSGYKSLPDGRGVLFVEVTEQVPVEVKRAGQVIEYKMMGARVPLRNNRNPLLLRDFNSSAVSAVLVPDKKAVRLVVTLRASVQLSHKMLARGRGAVLEIEVPALPAR